MRWDGFWDSSLISCFLYYSLDGKNWRGLGGWIYSTKLTGVDYGHAGLANPNLFSQNGLPYVKELRQPSDRLSATYCSASYLHLGEDLGEVSKDQHDLSETPLPQLRARFNDPYPHKTPLVRPTDTDITPIEPYPYRCTYSQRNHPHLANQLP